MTPTIFGYLIAAAAIFMMPASMTMMLGLVLIASLLGGASAVTRPSLGGSSITPANFALVFLVIRILLSPAGRFPIVAKALVQNPFLAFFCIYGFITAFLLPRLFFHVMNVPQLRGEGAGIFSTAPVEFSSQNITTGVYLIGTFLAFLCALDAGENAEADRHHGPGAAHHAPIDDILHRLCQHRRLYVGFAAEDDFYPA